MGIWNKVSQVWERLCRVDWSKIILTILKLAKRSSPKIDPKYLEIKPRALSDENLLKALYALKTVLSVIPPTALFAHVLTLGDVGFRIWKRLALAKGYDSLVVGPIGRNLMVFKVTSDPTLNTHFSHLVSEEKWEELGRVVDDFRFVTDPEILQSKYPQILPEYIVDVCRENKSVLRESLKEIEQVIVAHKHIPIVEQNVREAVDALQNVFPAMRDWSLLKSETFDEVVEIIDTLV